MGINLKETSSFDISLEGDRTGEKWYGQFSCFKRLSHRQELMRDRIKRDLLGPNSDGASQRAIDQADMIAELQISLVDAPNWWKESGNGLDLGDDNIILAIYNKVLEVKIAAVESIRRKGDEAGEKLKEIAETNTLAKK